MSNESNPSWRLLSTYIKFCGFLSQPELYLCLGDTIVACGGVDENHYSTDLCFSLQAGCSLKNSTKFNKNKFIVNRLNTAISDNS